MASLAEMVYSSLCSDEGWAETPFIFNLTSPLFLNPIWDCQSREECQASAPLMRFQPGLTNWDYHGLRTIFSISLKPFSFHCKINPIFNCVWRTALQSRHQDKMSPLAFSASWERVRFSFVKKRIGFFKKVPHFLLETPFLSSERQCHPYYFFNKSFNGFGKLEENIIFLRKRFLKMLNRPAHLE